MEKRLARRIHKQRLRLRQLEGFSDQMRQYKIWSRSKWLDMACRLLRENRELRERLGIGGQFDQRASSDGLDSF